MFTETCRCRPHLTTNWRNYPPYVNVTSLSTPGIIIPKLLTGVISECCGDCLDHGESKLDFTCNGNNGTAQRNSSEDLLQNIDDQTDFSFPVIGYKLQDSYKGGLGYAPFVESAGVAFVVYTDTSGVKDAMFDALIACWPVIVIPLAMAYIAGVTVWILVSNMFFFSHFFSNFCCLDIIFTMPALLTRFAKFIGLSKQVEKRHSFLCNLFAGRKIK